MPTVTYCSVADVSDFLRVPITATTTPNKTQVEKLIVRKEEELDRRIGHTFGRNKTISNEVHSLPLIYSYGWGTPIYLQHRNCRDFNSASGDKIEIWKGAGGNDWEDITAQSGWWQFEPTYGRLFLRGFLFSILRDYRVKVTYRYGDASVPDDVKDACIKLVARDVLTTSFRLDILPIGGDTLSWNDMIGYWKEDIEQCIENRKEVFVIT
jgi:hypothetical protein